MEYLSFTNSPKRELISIIVPVYQVEDYLPETLNSVLAQSYNEWELILVDDGSRDRSGQICDEYAKRDDRIRVIHKENGGVSSARNVGIQNAKGMFTTFLDADDRLMPEFIERLYFDMVTHEADIVCCNCVQDPEIRTLLKEPLVLENRIIDDWQQPFRDMTIIKELYWSVIWGKLYRTSLVKDCSFRPLRYGEDMVFFFDILLGHPRIFLDTYEGYVYVVRAGSAMNGGENWNLSRLKDDVWVDHYRWKKLPTTDDMISKKRMSILAQRIHNLAYAQAICRRNDHDVLLHEMAEEVLYSGTKLSVVMTSKIRLLYHLPKVYELSVRIMHGLRGKG